MSKTAELVSFDTTIAATVPVSDAFYGYPKIIEFDSRYFTFRDGSGPFRMSAVDSTEFARYDEATIQ